jgi:hypothetical protein
VIGAWGAAVPAFRGTLPAQTGVLLGEEADTVAAQAIELLGQHRMWEREDPEGPR